MTHPLAPLLARPIRSIACLIAGGTFLCLMGGFDGPAKATEPPSNLRHAAARLAVDHLERLRGLTVRLDTVAHEPGAALDQDLKEARRTLGADMIALREMVAATEEVRALASALAALARYQAAWTDARVLAQSSDPDGAVAASAAAAPLGDRAAAALASLAHEIDRGNAAAEETRRAAERHERFRAAGLALLAAGLLLLGITRGRSASTPDGASSVPGD